MWAERAITPAMHCGHQSMPCCPHTDGQRAQCPPAQCAQPVPQKTENFKLQSGPAVEDALLVDAVFPLRVMARQAALHPRFPASVFRIKGELRI